MAQNMIIYAIGLYSTLMLHESDIFSCLHTSIDDDIMINRSRIFAFF